MILQELKNSLYKWFTNNVINPSLVNFAYKLGFIIKTLFSNIYLYNYILNYTSVPFIEIGSFGN